MKEAHENRREEDLESTKMKKKGDVTLDNALETIIVVVGLVLIAFFVYKVYDSAMHQDERDAQKTVDVISTKLKAIGKGNSGQFTVQGIKASDKDYRWLLFLWDKDSSPRPEQCFFQSCICICRYAFSTYEALFSDIGGGISDIFRDANEIAKNNEQTNVDICQKVGVCRNIDAKFTGSKSYFIQFDPKLYNLQFNWGKDGVIGFKYST